MEFCSETLVGEFKAVRKAFALKRQLTFRLSGDDVFLIISKMDNCEVERITEDEVERTSEFGELMRQKIGLAALKVHRKTHTSEV